MDDEIDSKRDGEIDSKITTESTEDISCTITTYNINRAVEAEKHTDTCWERRSPKVRAIIESQNADVICLQECRKLDTSDTVDMMYELKDYRYFTFYANPSDLALALVIGYKPSKFYCVSSGTRWLSDTPSTCSDSWGNGWGRIVAYMELQPVSAEKKIFSNKRLFVFTTHFGLSEEEKKEASIILPGLMNSIAGEHPCVVLGDFNVFYDMDGDKQIEILSQERRTNQWCESFRLQHWTSSYVTIAGVPANRTYVPYTYEREYERLMGMEKNTLDHVFARNLRIVGEPVVDTRTMMDPEPEPLSVPDSTPSDHLPVTVNFLI